VRFVILKEIKMKEIKLDIHFAKSFLDRGDLVAIPTETVYGLAANAFNKEAVEKIYELKQRPKNNPLIIHCHSIEQIKQFVTEIPKDAYELANQFWPGPLTILLKKNELIPDYVTAGSDYAAFRIPNHPITLELLKQLDYPLVAPSANPSNRISPTKAIHVYDYFKSTIPYILDGGDCNEGIESTIIHFENNKPKILRPGSITFQQLFYVTPSITLEQDENDSPPAPGMFKKHYSPTSPFKVVEKIDHEIIHKSKSENSKIAIITCKKENLSIQGIDFYAYSDKGDLNQIAANLYDTLITIDAKNYDLIISELAPEVGKGIAINNRLKRAQNF
jgi:L-threonylcarbamoyladenylate synthase